MYLGVIRLGRRIALLGVACGITGCTELYLVFGPGAVWGPQQVGVGSVTTTQPTVVPSPAYVVSQLDPLVESTAGAKIVVAAQLNDDNGDGRIDDNDLIDFVSASEESQPIQIHLNQGGGSSFSTYTIAGGGPIARMVKLEIADFDLDGRNDVAVLVNDTGFTPVQGADLRGAVVLLFSPADPTAVLSWQEVTLSATFVLPSDDVGMTDLAVGDVNGDGRPDIVLGSNEKGAVAKNIRLYINPGPASARTGNLWLESAAPITADAVQCKTVGLADIDGDGDLDVVASFPSAKTFNIRWLVNPLVPGGGAAVTAGNWTRKIIGQQAQEDPSSPGADFIALGDIDDDGDIDVAAAHAGLGLVQWFRNPARPGEPGGYGIVAQQTFPWEVFNLGRVNSGYTINQLQLVHMDGDGLLEGFLTASGAMVGLKRGSVVESFWSEFVITTTDPVAAIGTCAIRDINRDGLVDIVAPLNRAGLIQDQILVFRRISP
jgi:hypothetical protein